MLIPNTYLIVEDVARCPGPARPDVVMARLVVIGIGSGHQSDPLFREDSLLEMPDRGTTVADSFCRTDIRRSRAGPLQHNENWTVIRGDAFVDDVRLDDPPGILTAHEHVVDGSLGGRHRRPTFA